MSCAPQTPLNKHHLDFNQLGAVDMLLYECVIEVELSFILQINNTILECSIFVMTWEYIFNAAY
jgi:hypothetical protein